MLFSDTTKLLTTFMSLFSFFIATFAAKMEFK